MARRALAGFIVSAALGAVTVLDVGSSTAEAAPSVSPFAGTYVQGDPGGPWTFEISDAGRITGSYSLGSGRESSKGSLSGQVIADGSFSITVSESGAYCSDDRCRQIERWKASYQSTGNMVSDADGNIAGTTDDGGSFVWLRQ